MSHSTHVGFNLPTTRVRLWYAPLCRVALFASSPVGVGSISLIATAVSSRPLGLPASISAWLGPFAILTLGVGHLCTATFNGSLLRFHWLGPPLFLASWTVGVGQRRVGSGLAASMIAAVRLMPFLLRP